MNTLSNKAMLLTFSPSWISQEHGIVQWWCKVGDIDEMNWRQWLRPKQWNSYKIGNAMKDFRKTPPTLIVYWDGNYKTVYDLYRILHLCSHLDRIWSVPDLMQHPSSVRCYCANGINSRSTVSLSSDDAQSLMSPSNVTPSRLFSDQKETKLICLFGDGKTCVFQYSDEQQL